MHRLTSRLLRTYLTRLFFFPFADRSSGCLDIAQLDNPMRAITAAARHPSPHIMDHARRHNPQQHAQRPV
jgi:hypothetical protein